jgi:hypothetical protein
MHRRYWLALIVVLGATVLCRNRLRAYLKQTSANVRAFDGAAAPANTHRLQEFLLPPRRPRALARQP